MSGASTDLVLIGEVYIDLTLTPAGQENKLRFGGLVHAARGLWAAGVPFSVGAIAPQYVSESLPAYLKGLGCTAFRQVGTIDGAPNVILIGDQAEVGDQGYDTLLRDDKKVTLQLDDLHWANGKDVLIFPGQYDWPNVVRSLPENCRIHIDFAYDVGSPADLAIAGRHFQTLFVSTSSEIFEALRPCTRAKLVSAIEAVDYDQLIIKENRGGSVVYDKVSRTFENVPAQLEDDTVNSVGVGDLYDAIYIARQSEGASVAARRASRAAAAYAQTTFPDVLRTLIARAMRVPVTTLGKGVILPWDDRPELQIYLAAPDFEDYPRREIIVSAASALEYHNFKVVRPVLENGELERPASGPAMRRTFNLDKDLLEKCAGVMAIPLDRDPGTLVEVGLALQLDIPVVVFDPSHDAENTMVVGGAAGYSSSFGACLNALFRALSKQ